ncbi:putative Serpin domain-containing protein [Helianthus debilis subsp. tardiflorus]
MEFRQSIKNQTGFSITFATHLLSKKFQNSDVVFSPLSMHVILSLLAAGSEGRTLDQLLAFLKAGTT